MKITYHKVCPLKCINAVLNNTKLFLMLSPSCLRFSFFPSLFFSLIQLHFHVSYILIKYLLLFFFYFFVKVFVHAKVFFSIGGQHFNGEPVHFSYMPDTIMEHARDVTIKLHHRIGKFVQIHLYFAARWIMLSEVSFISGKILLLLFFFYFFISSSIS